MRLTVRLYKQSHVFRLKQLRAKANRIREPHFVLPKPLAAQGIEPVDARKYLYASVVDLPKWSPPVPDDPRFTGPPKLEDHPCYHEEWVYHCDFRTKLMEGERQALALTKTQAIDGLPYQVQELIEAVEIPDQDALLQRIIMQANVWDPSFEKLPRRFNPDLPRWKFKAEFGIPKAKIISKLLSNMLRLCDSLGMQDPSLLTERQAMHDSYVSTYFLHKGKNHIRIQSTVEWLVAGKHPLAPFASDAVVDATVTHQLPDLFPVSPTIDLSHEHIWKYENITGMKETSPFKYPHLLMMSNDDDWDTSQRTARMIMFMFSHCLAVAKQLYGHDAKSIPVPITTQCISADETTFHFGGFQLNTLNFDSDNGVKNLVWLDRDNKLFNKIIPKRAMLRNTRYEDYDPVVFKKVLAAYLLGQNLVAQQNKLQGEAAL